MLGYEWDEEPNNGFRLAQKINVPQGVDGLIQHARDVDVFRFEGQEGQRIVCERGAQRLDSTVSVALNECPHRLAGHSTQGQASPRARNEATAIAVDDDP